MRSRTDDGPLPGGTANHGRVVRVGDTVHRPRGLHSPSVHALLTHLARQGFTGAPRVLAAQAMADESAGAGRIEVLSYIEGNAATEPLADWALTDTALVSVGELLREYHHHARTFDPAGHRWQRQVPTRWRGPLITHNDVNPANVIFRDGRAVALIDFDLAAPATPAWELAVTACFWAPLRSTDDIEDGRQGRVWERFRTLLDSYGATSRLRREVVEASVEANDWIAGIIEDASRRGHPAFGRLWAMQAERYARADDWLRRNQGRLADVAG